MFFRLLLLFMFTDPLGKFDVNDLPTQSKMEMLTEEFIQNSRFKDAGGILLPYDDWCGVTVDAENSVIKIDWGSVSPATRLGGTFNFSLVPDSVLELVIPSNDFRGTLCTESLPRDLVVFYGFRNFFTGEIDLTRLPPTLREFLIRNNEFHGSLCLILLPETLEKLLLNRNLFSGSISLTHLPQSLVYLTLSNNRLTGILNVSNLPPEMEMLNLEGNDFFGTLDFAQFSDRVCLVVKAYGNPRLVYMNMECE